MEDSEIIRNLIQDSAKINLEDHYKKKKVLLKEDQTSSEVQILNVPEDSLVIRVDAFQAPKSIFNNIKGVCKRADFVLISFTDKTIIYIEMKKSTGKWSEVLDQLKGAECFIYYCQKIGIAYWENEDFLKQYKHRFVVIGGTNLAKEKTRVTKSQEEHDTPSRALKINNPNNLQYKSLI
ncbi:hypothetical protein Lrub_0712 [Legionella rubrilucens]|uniref:Uncharacterized protein n=1 Tax=Legionella rubrilucens TaxID=458 RepID=A0A0W0XXR7_9GAMM|nr:hypothetical protein [Legionella rubrilucens]KTD49613.1 hypothetical protein Lrub_0712 [Legionella rubrilucens]